MIAGGLLLGWAATVAGASGTALLKRRRMATEPGPSAGPVVLVRPCAGDTPGLARRLRSVAHAHRAGLDVAVRITVARADDPAWPVAQAAADALRARGFDAQALVVPTDAPNQKAGQLAGLSAQLAPDAVLVNADSDVDLTHFDLPALLAPLDAGAGAAWAPPVEVCPTTLGDRASAAFLNGSLHAFHLLGGLDPNGLVGKVMALRLDRFQAAGGFAGLDHCLGEDMEIARRLREAGLAAPMVAVTVRSEAQDRAVADAVGRYARWLAVIRGQRPALLASYPLMFGATTPIVCLGLLAGPLGWAAAGLAATTRLAVAGGARRAAGLPAGPATLVADWLLGDAVTWAAFLRAASSRKVVWRGRTLSIGGTGDGLGLKQA